MKTFNVSLICFALIFGFLTGFSTDASAKRKKSSKKKNDTTLVVPKPKENKDSVEYRKLIKDAVSKEGLLTTHFTPQRKLYWEIPDSAFEHTYMLSNRIAATSNTQDFVAGQMATQPIWLQLSRDSINVYLHKVQTQNSVDEKESIAAAYPNTEYQRCIVHQVRNTLKYVAEKDKKAFTNDLKSIYHAPNEESGYERMQSVTKKWQEKYPNAMRRWEENWDVLSPMFKFSAEVRKVMYTTNAIESLNSALRRLNSQRSVFPSDTALLKALYLATFEATKKWTMPIRNWGQVYGELSLMYEGRLPM